MSVELNVKDQHNVMTSQPLEARIYSVRQLVEKYLSKILFRQLFFTIRNPANKTYDIFIWYEIQKSLLSKNGVIC